MATPEKPVDAGGIVKSETPVPQAPSDHYASAPAANAVPASKPGGRSWTKRIIGGIVLLVLIIGAVIWYIDAEKYVSTDDAYVDGHVTFVAPRVAGQVAKVLVEDNNRVKTGDLLVQLDKEPFQVQVNVAQAQLTAAQADLAAAQAQAHGLAGQTRSLRFALQHAMEDVDNQAALLRAKVATLDSQRANLAKAQADYDRALPLVQTGGVSREEIDRRKQLLDVAKSQVEEAMQNVYQIRVGLGLPPEPGEGKGLADVPADLNQTFSSVRKAQASLVEAASAIGVINSSFDQTPKEMVAEFYRRDPEGNIDRIYAGLLKNAPNVKQAEAKLLQAQRNLEKAELDLRYCDVIAEIDGVVTRRNVNPGNNVIAGQGLMAVRSLTDVWVEANFKETQIGQIRIGQKVDLDVDMYGSRARFQGRVSGFSMGTGSTLALLPPENATGNFVKVVQRVPVRIELVDYDPSKVPLFVGLSVTPTVHIAEGATGENAGGILQTYMKTASGGATGSKVPEEAKSVITPGSGVSK